MAKVPTYQDLNRQRAEEVAVQSQTEQRNAVLQDAEIAANNNRNPVLAEYMSRNSAPQGLVPRNTVVPDQQAYSLAMVDAAMKGQVPTETVLADANVLEQAKIGLMNSMRQNQGLGQLAQ